jgi:hypothetical protein
MPPIKKNTKADFDEDSNEPAYFQNREALLDQVEEEPA